MKGYMNSFRDCRYAVSNVWHSQYNNIILPQDHYLWPNLFDFTLKKIVAKKRFSPFRFVLNFNIFPIYACQFIEFNDRPHFTTTANSVLQPPWH